MLGDASWKKHVMTTDGAKWPNVSGDHSKFFWKIQRFLVCSAFENVRNLNRLWVMWDSWLVIVLIGQPCHDLNFADTVTTICCSIVPVGQVQSGEQGMSDGWRGLKSVWKSWIRILHHGAFRMRYCIGTPTDEPFVFLAIPSALVARNTRWTEEFTSLEASKEAYFCWQGVGAHESTPTVTVLYTDTVDQKWNLINKIHIFLRLVAP